MLLGERLRGEEEKEVVRSVLEKRFSVSLEMETFYEEETRMSLEMMEGLLSVSKIYSKVSAFSSSSSFLLSFLLSTSFVSSGLLFSWYIFHVCRSCGRRP